MILAVVIVDPGRYDWHFGCYDWGVFMIWVVMIVEPGTYMYVYTQFVIWVACGPHTPYTNQNKHAEHVSR